MNKITEATSQKIKNMSLLCALLVVAIHIGWPHDTPLSAGWFINETIKEGIARIAVPFFFVVSGFFLAQHFDEDGWYGREVRKRVKSLVVPFICWSLIYLVAPTPLSIVADIIAHRPFGTSIAWPHGHAWMRVFGLDLAAFPYHYPLWYVRCLFLFILTSMLFKRGVVSLRYIWLAGAFLLCLVFNHIPNETMREVLRMGYSASSIFYFSVGIFIRRFKLKAGTVATTALCGAIGIALLAAKLCFVYHNWQGVTVLGKLSLPFLIYATWRIIPATRIPGWLTSLSFPLFLIHAIALAYIGILKKHLPIGDLPYAFCAYAFSICTSTAVALLLRRFTPRLSRILFGGR